MTRIERLRRHGSRRQKVLVKRLGHLPEAELWLIVKAVKRGRINFRRYVNLRFL